MKYFQILFFVAIVLSAFAQSYYSSKEYHVSVTGDDKSDGSDTKLFKTISAAANVAMPGDVITDHAGTYRESISPPRGGNSDQERIVYQATPGEKVEIKGSEIIKDWQKLNNNTWEVKIPNTFFGKFNPYSDLIRGDWFNSTPKDWKYHTGAVYLNGDWLMEAAEKEEVMKAADEKNPLWWAEFYSTMTTIWAQFKNSDPNEQKATERNALIKDDFDASVTLSKQEQEMYLEITLDKNWLTQKRNLVTIETLTNAIVPNLPFENVDGSPVEIDMDYFGDIGNVENPLPGPFEIKNAKKQKFKVWPVM